jgi:hypothetical protein
MVSLASDPSYCPAKQGNIVGRKGVPRVHCAEINVSDVVTMMRMAAMIAEKAMSCAAVSRRWFMLTVK